MLPEHMCLVLLGWSLPHPGLNAFRGFPSAWMVSPWGLLSRGMGLMLPVCVTALLLVPVFPFPVVRLLGSWAPPSPASVAESQGSRGGQAVTGLGDGEGLGP